MTAEKEIRTCREEIYDIAQFVDLPSGSRAAFIVVSTCNLNVEASDSMPRHFNYHFDISKFSENRLSTRPVRRECTGEHTK